MRVSYKKACVSLTFIALLGCSDGLIYGERTSLDLASVRVNDDPATPVAIKLGFDRDVVLVAPPIGGQGEEASKGEAVSQFSSFSVNAGTPFIGTEAAAWQTWVHSRFASGGAALAISKKPKVVAAVLGSAVPSAKEQVVKIFLQLDPVARERLCELAAKGFDDLTASETQEAGRLTRSLSLYDRALHMDVRDACRNLSVGAQ